MRSFFVIEINFVMRLKHDGPKAGSAELAIIPIIELEVSADCNQVRVIQLDRRIHC
jgi:hypothetical protein